MRHLTNLVMGGLTLFLVLFFIWALVKIALMPYPQPPSTIKTEVRHKYSTIPNVPYSKEDLIWLAKNIYFEARGEPTEGQYAVAFVTMHRVYSKDFPNTIKEVVTQQEPNCQFSWTCDGKPDRINNLKAWNEAMFVASQVLQHKIDDPVLGAMFFHVPKGDIGNWKRIGNHIFSVGK